MSSRPRTNQTSVTSRGSKRTNASSMSTSVRRQQHHQQQLLKPAVQAIPDEFIDLSDLTQEEKDQIQAVLDRDAEIRRREQERVVIIKKEIREIRMRGVIRNDKDAEGDTSDSCARCRKKFGLVFNRPRVCIICSHRVCSKCSQQVHKPYQNFYICSLCIKQIELESMTGQWFELLQAAKSKKIGRKMTSSAGAEIVMASLKRARTQEDGESQGSRAEGIDEVDSRSGTANGRVVGAQSRSILSSQSGGHGSEGEENEDIGDMFDRYGGLRKKSASQTNLERLSPFSSSKESIVSMYSNAGSESFGKFPVSGEIEFALSYNYKQSTLEVHIKQCRNIHAVDSKRHSSDAYVKTYLLPDKTKNGKRKTRVKKHTTSPIFDEVVKYHVTKSELESRTLCVMVWNNDRFGRNDFLGEVNVGFDHHSFDDQSPKWYRLQDRQNLSSLSVLTYKGDINVCLRFVSSSTLTARRQAVASTPDGNATGHGSASSDGNGVGELHVVVKQARNLTPVRANGHSDPFCKCNLLPDRSRHGTQKSPVIKRNCNPNWNHTFVFENVSWNDLRERSLELTIWDHDRLVSNDFLGGVRLNLGTGRSSGDPVDWMDSKGEEISLWQAMLDRPNCWIEGTLLLRVHMGQRQ